MVLLTAAGRQVGQKARDEHYIITVCVMLFKLHFLFDELLTPAKCSPQFNLARS